MKISLLLPLLPLLLVSSLCAANLAANEPPVARDGTPNILILFADDLGYEALNCYGGLDFETPHLDRLAAEGMRFTRAYTSPVCTPSRMSLYTGTYTSRHGHYGVLPVHKGTRQAVDFRSRHRTFAQLLREAGYATSVTGKWQLATLEYHPEHCREAGFDSWCVWQIWRNGAKTTRYWDPCLNHDGKVREDIADRFGSDVLHEYVIGQMESAVAEGRPFYIHHNFMLPHWPVTATPDDKAASGGAGREGSLAGMIRYLDKLCGDLVETVDEMGIADNTWIIFMGDNGTEAFGEPRRTTAGLVEGGKRDLTDAGTHIPLIVRRPSTLEAGQVCDDLIDIADWFPTICELTGVTIPDEVIIDGVSFAGRLLRHEPSPRRWVTGGYGGKMSVFDGTVRVTDGQAVDQRDAAAKRLQKVLESLPRS